MKQGNSGRYILAVPACNELLMFSVQHETWFDSLVNELAGYTIKLQLLHLQAI